MCMRIPYFKCRPGKGNLFATFPTHFLTSQNLGNVNLVQCMFFWILHHKNVLFKPTIQSYKPLYKNNAEIGHCQLQIKS